jgi:hypothetical protein
VEGIEVGMMETQPDKNYQRHRHRYQQEQCKFAQQMNAADIQSSDHQQKNKSHHPMFNS